MARLTFTIMITMFAFGRIFAQSPIVYLTPGIDAIAYKGDLSGIERWTGGFHLGLRFNHKRRLNGSFELGISKLNGQNINYSPSAVSNEVPTPNKFFNTPVVVFHYSLIFNIIKQRHFHLFASQGFGLIHYNPKDQFNEELLDQRGTRLPGEYYVNTVGIFPTSLGIIYLFSNYFGFGLNISLINPQTDYLDNISDWGVEKGNDNALQIKLSFIVPLIHKRLKAADEMRFD